MGDKVSFGMVYYLNGAKQAQMKEDLSAIKDCGCDSVFIEGESKNFLYYADNKKETADALELCGKMGLKAYLINHLVKTRMTEKEKSERMVNFLGEEIERENIFSPSWRTNYLFPALKEIIDSVRGQRALSGYVFADLAFDGDPVGYDMGSKERFRIWLKKKYDDLLNVQKSFLGMRFKSWGDIDPPTLLYSWAQDWKDWVEARQNWFAEYTFQLTYFVRQTDGAENRQVILYEPIENMTVFGRTAVSCGGHIPASISPFDVLGMEHFYQDSELLAGKDLKRIENSLFLIKRMTSGKDMNWMPMVSAYSKDNVPAYERIVEPVKKAIGFGIKNVCYCAFNGTEPGTKSAKGKKGPKHTNLLKDNKTVLKELTKFHSQY